MGAVTNALNMPSISAEDAPRLKPYVALGAQIGELAGQIVEGGFQSVEIEYQGSVTEVNTDPITATILSSLLKTQLDSVNMVNALQIAEARDIQIKQSYSGSSEDHRSLINVIVISEDGVRNVAGTLFTGKEPRIVNIESVPIEAALTEHMLCIHNDDTPGFIGRIGALLGDAGYNISDFRLGRIPGEQHAVALASVEKEITDEVLAEIRALDQVK